MTEKEFSLARRFENAVANQETIYLAEEEYEVLLVHYFSSDDYDRTLEVADYAILQYTFTPEFYKWKALIHKINLQEERALDALEKLITYAPNDREALMLRLEVLTHFEHTEAGRDVLRQLYGVVEGKEQLSMLSFFDGLLHLQEHQHEAAWKAFREAIKLDGQQEAAYDELLNAPELDTYRAEIGKFLQKLVDIRPLDDMAWYYFGLWSDDGGRNEIALEAFANARSLNPERSGYDLEYADKLFDLDRFPEALKVYRAYQSSVESEESYETHMRIGRSHQMLGDVPAARKSFLRAIELSPDMYDIYQHLGETYVSQEKWPMAVYYYGRAVELPDHTSECWLGLALSNSAVNDPDEAEKAFRRAVKMDEYYSDAFVSFSLFLIDQGRENEAIALLEETFARYRDASLWYGTVAVHLLCNRRKRALEYLNDALAACYDEHDLLLEWHPALSEDPDVSALLAYHAPN